MLKSSTKHKKYLLLLREEVHIGSQTFACTNSISLIALLAFLFRKTSQYCFPNTWFSQTSSTCFTRGKSYIVFAFAKSSKLLKFRCPNLWCYNQLSSNIETWHAYVSPPSIKGKKLYLAIETFTNKYHLVLSWKCWDWKHDVTKLNLTILLLSLSYIDIDLNIQPMSLTLYMTCVH